MGPTTTHLNRPYEAITVVLSNYFDALYESDAAKLSRAIESWQIRSATRPIRTRYFR